ncbi:MAG: C-GCAxxG-C-C family protein [Deltaproteobacteria bacterium]|jgi:C_GCAxxG_C_C family probable redox protein|nr:C-GCAxxG-C-C family protein [Deltaproteobacteria bacterium]
MDSDRISGRALGLFDEGFHCSQAVFCAVAEALSLQAGEVSAVASSLSPFGGGMGSSGNICGNLSGALAVLGVLMGKREPKLQDDKNIWRASNRMVREFEEITKEYHGMNCRDIARIDWRNREDVRAFRANPEGRRRECCRVMDKTVRALVEILKELQAVHSVR